MQVFRDLVHGLFGKVVLGVVIALFVLYGTEALMSLAVKPEPMAQVNDAELYREQLAGMVEQQKQMIVRQNPGLPLDFLKDEYLRSQVIQQWVNRNLIQQAIQEWGVRPDQDAVISQLKTDNRFAVDGEIQTDTLESFLRTNNLTTQDLFDDIRTNLSLDTVLTSLEASAFVVPKEVKQIEALQGQTRQFKVATIKADDLQDQVTLTDSAVKKYYDDNIQAYMSPDQAEVSYLEIDAQSQGKAIEPMSDDELHAYYDNYLQNLKSKEKRQSAHILIEIDDRSEAQALKIANEVKAKIVAGEDFAALAQQYSDDAPSAEDGGLLPLSEPGTFVPAFEDALYSLQQDEVSAPIKTEFGYHLIKLAAIEAKAPKSLADKKAEFKAEYKKASQKNAYRTFLDNLAVLSFESSNLEEVAAQNDLKLQTAPAFSQGQAPSALRDPKVLKAIFTADFFEAGRNSDIIELKDKAVIVHPIKFIAAAPKPFKEVQAEVKIAATKVEAQKLAAEKGRKLIAKLRAGQDLTKKEQALFQWQDHSAIDRRSDKVSAIVLAKAFAMPKPMENITTFAGVADQSDFVLSQLEDVQTPKAVDLEKSNQLAIELRRDAAQALTALLIDALKDDAKIEYNSELL